MVNNINYIAEPYMIRCDKSFGKSLLVSIINHIMSILHVAGRRWLGSLASSMTPVVCFQHTFVLQTHAVLSESFVSWTFKPLEWGHCSCGNLYCNDRFLPIVATGSKSGSRFLLKDTLTCRLQGLGIEPPAIEG